MKITQEFHQATRANRRRRKWQKLVRFLAMTVVFCTTYALILPAITMEAETICGKAAHTHTGDCYESVIPECTIAESEDHVHEESTCYTLVTTQICQLEENEDHTHGPSCHQVELKLQCQIPEYQGHSHAEDSKEPVLVLICPLEEHIHEDRCFPEDAKPADLDTDPTPGEPLETDPDATELTEPSEPGATEIPETTVPATEGNEPDPTLGTAPKETDAPTQAPSEPTDEATQAPTQEATQAPTDEATDPTTESTAEATTENTTEVTTEEATEEPTEEPTVTLVQTDETEDGAKIQVRLPEDTQLPADASLSVTDLGDIALFTGRDAQLEEIRQVLPEAESIVSLLDISFYNEAGDYIPVSDTATVTIRYEGDVLGNQEVRVIHYTDEGAVVIDDVTLSTSTNTDENGNETVSTLLSFETDGFSVFAVVEVVGEYEQAPTLPATDLAGDYYILNNDSTRAMMAVAITNTDKNYPAIQEATVTDTADLSTYSVWTVEQVVDNTYRIYSTDENGANQYLYASHTANGNGNWGLGALTLTSDVSAATVFTAGTVDGKVQFYSKFDNAIRYITELNDATLGGDAYGFTMHTATDGNRMTLYRRAVETETTVPVTNLGGKSYAIVNTTTKVGMTATADQEDTAKKAALDAEPITTFEVDSTTYISGDSTQIVSWTFIDHDANKGIYYISTQVGGATKYLNMTTEQTGDLTLSDTPQPLTVTQKPDGRVLIGNGYTYINSSGSDAERDFWCWSNGNTDDSNSLHTLCVLQSSSSQDTYTVQYNMNLPTDTTTLMGAKPTVENSENYSAVVEAGGSHTSLDPYPSFYTRVFSTKANEIFDFAGWKLLDGSVIQPGTPLDFDDMASLNVDGEVVLLAQWTLRTNHTSTVNFYVNQICQVIDANGDSAIPDDSSSTDAFTNSVWAATLNISSDIAIKHWQNDANNDPNGGSRFILYTKEKDKTRATDEAIRSLLVTNGGYDTTTTTYISTGAWKNSYTGNKIFTVDSFPSDEVVMAQVRKWLTDNPDRSISLGDGSVVYSSAKGNIDQVNTNRFTIRYNKFFYSDSGDTWHIDGVLVAKQATTVIKKTFQGDPTAISQIKENYFINVENRTHPTAPDGNLKLTLNPKEEETDGDLGYTSYDATTNTYTWVITGEQGTQYNVKENNYIFPSDAYITDADYTHTNIPDRVLDWTEYPTDGINFTGIAYAVGINQDAFQTVSFRNIYIKPDVLTIQKIDTASGRGLSGVKFALGLPEGHVLSYSPSQKLYSTVAGDLGTEDFEAVVDNKVVTDISGSIMIKVPAIAEGTTVNYTLTEEIPTGYNGIENLTVTLGLDDNIVGFKSVTSTDTPDLDISAYVNVTRDLLTIKNNPPTISISAQKEWADGETPLPVQVELWVNGAKAQPVIFTVWLNQGNNWTHTWNNMPLYIDGDPTVYTLREIYIGTDTAFDATADVDGYSNYIVSYDPMVYCTKGTDANGNTIYNPVSGPSYTYTENGEEVTGYAQHGILKVHNSSYRGQIILLKQGPTGNPLADAVFGLYSDPECTQELARATTGALGRAIFDRQLVGTYYAKELTAPLGYHLSDEVYTITVAPSGVTVAKADGTQVNAIVNQPYTTDLTILKLANMNSPLTGAGFTLTSNGKTIFRNQMVDANGTLVVENLTAGTYILTETVFPTGYLTLSQPITITVTANENDLEISVPPNFSNDYALEEGAGGYTLKVNNRSNYQLPQTGGPGTGHYLPIGLLLMAAAILPQLRDKKKRQRGRG